MKNKIIASILAIVTLIVVVAPSQTAEAQVVFTRNCCDGNGYYRCVLGNWTPVGNSCFCYGQGYGIACL